MCLLQVSLLSLSRHRIGVDLKIQPAGMTLTLLPRNGDISNTSEGENIHQI